MPKNFQCSKARSILEGQFEPSHKGSAPTNTKLRLTKGWIIEANEVWIMNFAFFPSHGRIKELSLCRNSCIRICVETTGRVTCTRAIGCHEARVIHTNCTHLTQVGVLQYTRAVLYSQRLVLHANKVLFGFFPFLFWGLIFFLDNVIPIRCQYLSFFTSVSKHSDIDWSRWYGTHSFIAVTLKVILQYWTALPVLHIKIT